MSSGRNPRGRLREMRNGTRCDIPHCDLKLEINNLHTNSGRSLNDFSGAVKPTHALSFSLTTDIVGNYFVPGLHN